VPQNTTEAAKWYRNADDQGHAKSQYNLALSYAKGDGLLQNYVQARKWSVLASSQGIEGASESASLYAKQMTPEQITQSDRFVRDFKPHLAPATDTYQLQP
jgi:TPR repeat protein